MTESTTTAAATETKAAEVKTVLNSMDSRRVFPNAEAALAYISERSESLADFSDHPLVIAGLDDEGQLDPEVYNDSMDVAVAVLTRKGNKEAGVESTVIAIVVFPCPKLEAILESNEARDWLISIMHKEFNHVAVRNLRKAESASDLEDARQGMPCSIADYTTTQRETTSGILAVFDATWQQIKRGIGKKFKVFATANLSKKELRRGIESASYAAATYPTLENRTFKGEPMSLFALAATLGAQLAEAASLDPSFYTKALETRDSKIIETADEEEDDIDLDALMAAATAPTKAEAASESAANSAA